MTTWVLLRGLMRESRHWGDFPIRFQQALGAEKVVMPDFPGNGRLHAQASHSSVAEMAHYCHDQLQRLGHKPPYRVLALSLGAMVAVEWSRQHPEEIANLVLINTSLAPHNSFYHRLKPKNYPALIGYLFTGSKAGRERLILKLTSNKDFTPEQQAILLGQWSSYAQDKPVARANILRQLYAAVSYHAPAIAPRTQVLLLAGLGDRLVDAQCSRTLAKQWGCPIVLHESAGHDLPLDEGTWVAEQVRLWLAALPQSR
jgi:pimeloyl-ACP methyl ester carboxylesterase